MRIARARREYDDAALFQMAYSATAYVGLGYRLDGYRALCPGGDVEVPFEGVLQGQRVNDGREHSRVVGRGPVHPLRFRLSPPPDVPPSDHYPHLQPQLQGAGYLAGHVGDCFGVQAVASLPLERLPAQLQEHASIAGAVYLAHYSPRENLANRRTRTFSPSVPTDSLTRS